MPASDSLSQGALPLGLAHQVTLQNPVAAGQIVRWNDVRLDDSLPAVKSRREMEALFASPSPAAA